MKRRVLLVAVLAFVMLSSFASAQIPHQITYQGRVTTASGDPISDGTYSFKFTIYDAGDVPYWTETQGLAVVNGYVNATLGVLVAIPDSVFNSADRYLGIDIDHQGNLTPLTRLFSVPYAYKAQAVKGDVSTAPGELYIDDGYGDKAFDLLRGGDQNIFMMNYNVTGLPYTPRPAFTIQGNSAVGASFRLYHPGGEVMGVEPSPFHTGYTFSMKYPDTTPSMDLVRMQSVFGEGAQGMLSLFDTNGDSVSLTPSQFDFFSGANRSISLGPLGIIVQNVCQTTPKAGSGKTLFIDECGTTSVDTTGDTIMYTDPDGTYYTSTTKAPLDAYYSRYGLKVSEGANAGFVMTSDSAGVGSWQPPGGGPTPVAYGSINASGTIYSSYNVSSCSWNPTYLRYEITISGETYIYSNFSTVVTTTGGQPRVATTSSVSGRLLVYLFDLSSNSVQNGFQFVTYKM